MISLDDIQSAYHSIKVEPGSAPIQIGDNGGSLTVDAVNLDIRDLAFATDKVDASGSTVELGATSLAALESITVQNGSGAGAVNIQDGGNSITVDGTVAVSSVGGTVAVTQSTSPWVVSATDLDIRNLVFATDKVDVSGSSIFTTPAAFGSWQVLNKAVTSTASQLDASPLAGRLYVEIQNLGTADMYIGQSNAVTAVTGLKIPKGSSQAIDLDAGAAIWALTSSGTSDVRFAEYAA